jgi:hypothetical protein
VAEPSLFDDDSLVDDLTEDQFIGVIQTIINKDEILRIICGIALPVVKKPRKTRRSKVGRCTSETLQASIWGQLMSDIHWRLQQQESTQTACCGPRLNIWYPCPQNIGDSTIFASHNELCIFYPFMVALCSEYHCYYIFLYSRYLAIDFLRHFFSVR